MIIATYEEFIQRDREQDRREKDNWMTAIDLEKEKTKLAQAQAEIEKEKAAMYLGLYDVCRKKGGGFGCLLKRIFTLGLARC